MEKRQDIDFGILCSELEQGVIAGNEAKCRDIVGRILDNYIFLDMTIEERPPPKKPNVQSEFVPKSCKHKSEYELSFIFLRSTTPKGKTQG